MNSGIPPPVFSAIEERHKAAERLEALTNLVYLIGIEAANPANVKGYADVADGILTELRMQILPAELK